jgi:hypothetical protein
VHGGGSRWSTGWRVGGGGSSDVGCWGAGGIGGEGPKSSGEGRIRSLFAYMYIFKILNIIQNIEDIIHT